MFENKCEMVRVESVPYHMNLAMPQEAETHLPPTQTHRIHLKKLSISIVCFFLAEARIQSMVNLLYVKH